MRRFLLLPILAAILLSLSPLGRAEAAPLGERNIQLKVDYLNFTDSFIERNDTDNTIYVGVEGYGQLSPNIYLGGEIGLANPGGTGPGGVDTELTYIPLEINAKFAGEAAPQTVIDIGVGVSVNYVREQNITSVGSDESDFVLGGQFFGDVIYTSGDFFIGFNFKYQLTENFKDSTPAGVSYDFINWRIGGQAGMVF